MINVIENRLFVITGEKGIGKSALCRQVISGLQGSGITPGGIITFKTGDSGLMVEDIKTRKQEILASIQKSYRGPLVGKYFFNPAGLSFGMRAIEEGAGTDVLFVDELGHLEVRGEGFARAVSLINQRKFPSVVVIRQELLSKLLPQFTAQPHTFQVTIENRDELPSFIVGKLALALNKGMNKGIDMSTL